MGTCVKMGLQLVTALAAGMTLSQYAPAFRQLVARFPGKIQLIAQKWDIVITFY